MPDVSEMAAQPRRTPYELLFAEPGAEAEAFSAIREEARGRGVDPSDPDRFIQLASAGALLRELLPDDAAGAAVAEAGRLLFHAYHFWVSGRRGVLVEERLARQLLGPLTPIGEWELTPPHPAGYLQLPRSLLWGRVEQDAPAEPVDGFFWTMSGLDDPAAPPYARVDVLLALGMRPDRPGFSVVPVSAPLPGGPGHWGDLDARGEAADFSSVLPGGELSGLHSLVNGAEVLKLVSRCFWHAAAHPGALTELPPPGSGDAPALAWSVLHAGAQGG